MPDSRSAATALLALVLLACARPAAERPLEPASVGADAGDSTWVEEKG